MGDESNGVDTRVRRAVQAATKERWTWIREAWPFLLAGVAVISGAFGIYIELHDTQLLLKDHIAEHGHPELSSELVTLDQQLRDTQGELRLVSGTVKINSEVHKDIRMILDRLARIETLLSRSDK